MTYCYVLCLLLFLLIISGANQPTLAVSKDSVASEVTLVGQVSPPEGIELKAKYPALRGHVASTFEFEVELDYKGTVSREFELSAKAPKGFYVSIRPGYEAKEIGSIRLDPAKAYPETIKVVTSPVLLLYAERLPEPGEYVVTLSASSRDGKIKDSIDLKVIVIAKYDLKVETGGILEGRLNMKANAGEDNHLSLVITNTGTVPLEKVTFSSEKPGGWSVTFEPKEIESIPERSKREVEVTIKPPRKTIAGDYEVTLKVDTKDYVAYGKVNLRVTVLTPTIWGWVGVGIVVLVIAGLTVIFMRLGRR